jgi:exonuclease SbcC
MKFKELELTNFLSYEHVLYKFTDSAVLVQGINKTDENQKSNGSGKSGLQAGIEFALTLTNSRGVNDKELIRFGHKTASVKLIVDCPIRKEQLEIEATLNLKGSNKLSLSINSKPLSFSTVNDGKKMILNWLGISKEDLFNYFIINSTRFKSFFNSSNKEKVDLINRFSDSSIIDGLDSIDTSNLMSKKLKLETEINKTIGKIELLEESFNEELSKDPKEALAKEVEKIEDVIQGWEFSQEKHNKKIKACEFEIKDIKSDIQESESIIESLQNNDIPDDEREIKVIEKELLKNQAIYDEKEKAFKSIKLKDHSETKKAHKENLNKLESETSESDERTKSLNTNLSKAASLISELNAKLAGTIECPKCSNEFILDGDRQEILSKKTKAEAFLEKVNNKLSEETLVWKEIVKARAAVEDSIKQLNVVEDQEREQYRKEEASLSSARRILNDVEDKLSSLKLKLSKKLDLIKQEKSEIVDLNLEIKQQQLKITKNKNSIYINSKTIESLEAKISDLEAPNNEDVILSIKNNLNKLDQLKATLDADLISVEDAIKELDQWSDNFKQFRMYLANKSLETMQFQINKFLGQLKNDIRVRLDGFKVKANGSIKEEITATIIRDNERTFSSLSGGEQVRVLFSSILANRYLINSTHPYGGLDFLGVDEVFDKSDSLGMKFLVRSAAQLKTCIMIISHVSDEDLAGEEILTIVKENGISIIKT